MAEIDFKGTEAAAFISALGKATGLLELSPHGMRWHAAFKDKVSMDAALSALPAAASVRVIKPSLEDVFIRLVEGRER